jgi:hypothetical protein
MRTIIEPFKIKAVEPIRMTSRARLPFSWNSLM